MRNLKTAARITLVTVLVAVSEAPAAPSLKPHLSTFWDDWLKEVGLLLSSEEKAFFETLDDDEERELFAQGFWESRGPEALERWSSNLLAADQLRPRSTWARRALLLFGKPASTERIESCGGLRPLEVWRWEPWQVERQGGTRLQGRGRDPLILVLVQANRLLPGSFRPWDPSAVGDLGYQGSTDADLDTYLGRIRPSTCVTASLRNGLEGAWRFEALRGAMPWPSGQADWYGELMTRAELFDTRRRDALFEIDYPGTNGRHTILHGILRVKRSRLKELVPGQMFDRVSFVGDIYKRDYLVDSFEVVHHVAGAPPGDLVELDLFRGLRPGRYRLDLRVADGDGLTLLRTRRDLDVPRLSETAPPPPGRQQGYAQLTRNEVVLLDTFPSVEMLPVSSGAASTTDLFAITTGGPIAAVAFYVDDQLVGEDDSPPYSVGARLSDERHRVRAVAIDIEGRPLAGHSREVEAVERPFGVHLERPPAGRSMVPVVLSVPEGSELDLLECYDGRTLVATRTAPPFECPIPRRQVSGLRYARALATLSSGDSTEHLLFFGPNAPENIDVQLVELFVSVFDGSGRPVTGLSQSDFRIWEQGRQLALDRLESLADLPISVAVLMDLSSSMGRLAHLAAKSAERFFENILLDDDVASLLAFNDGFHRLVPFTDDIAQLRLGAEGVRALGSTRLHDGVVWALSQFAGQENRRAMVILSDGADVNSDFPFEQVVTAAVEAGVMVYPISIVRRGEAPTDHLQALADRTGGTRFIVGSSAALDTAYRRIAQELRSQYLLVYRLDDDAPGSRSGAVDIEVLRSGHTTRNIHGYYR